MSRRIVWFSCGAASAVAAFLCPDAEPVYCDVSADEHPDNARFMREIEVWIGRKVTVLRGQHASVEDVWRGARYMAGITGAPCTVAMKKKPRFDFQRADDRHIFGFTADERKRASRLTIANPELLLDWPLIDQRIDKADCMQMLLRAGIALPAMYLLGFDHNNCLGCVKATSPAYWNRIREHFPEVFARRAAQSRGLGARLVRIKGERRYLDELPETDRTPIQEELSCGPECALHPEPEVP